MRRADIQWLCQFLRKYVNDRSQLSGSSGQEAEKGRVGGVGVPSSCLVLFLLSQKGCVCVRARALARECVQCLWTVKQRWVGQGGIC